MFVQLSVMVCVCVCLHACVLGVTGADRKLFLVWEFSVL